MIEGLDILAVVIGGFLAVKIPRWGFAVGILFVAGSWLVVGTVGR